MSIPTTQLLGPYTNVIADAYKQMPVATNFLQSFFKTQIEMTRFVSYFVLRDDEQISVPVARGSSGNRNDWALSTMKTGDPMYFRENFDILPMQAYDAMTHPNLALTPSDAAKVAQMVRTIVDKQTSLVNKIKRAIEIACAQILMTGTIEFTPQMSPNGNGFFIDYLRKAESMPDDSGSAPWSTGSTDIFEQVEEDCYFLRTEGKSMDGEFNMIIGRPAFNAMIRNTTFLERQKLFNMKLDMINPPTRMTQTLGAVWQGRFSAGSFIVNVYTYPQSWTKIELSGGNIVRTAMPYIDDKKYALIPNNPYFKLYFGAVPPIVDGTGNAQPMAGDFVFTDWVGEDKRSHNYDVESCPLPVPLAVDQIVTRKVLA